jgi:dihydroorotate dehydrogenase (fumarate)
LVASASPLSKQLETARQLDQAGVSAIVMYSLFEEQIIQDSLKLHRDLERGSYVSAEALQHLPDFGIYSIGPESYLKHLGRVKREVSVPVIGSLNGVSEGGWVEYAQKIEDAGADALELNLYDLATDMALTSTELENRTSVVRIRRGIKIPLAVSSAPFTHLNFPQVGGNEHQQACCSTAFTSQISIWKSWRWFPTWC